MKSDQSIQNKSIECMFYKNRTINKNGVITFINAGDPGLEVTEALIKTAEDQGVDVIELGVPFMNSFTDGPVLVRSHQRAIEANTQLEDVLDMLKDHRRTSEIPVVLLADFSYTVKSRGMESFLQRCRESGANGVLLHGLPPLYVGRYLKIASSLNLETIFSVYSKTPAEKRRKIYSTANGFIYAVSQYGKTGSKRGTFNEAVLQYLRRIREETDLPIAVGFGVKTAHDLQTVYDTGADAAIIGSEIMRIVENYSFNTSVILNRFENYLNSLKFETKVA